LAFRAGEGQVLVPTFAENLPVPKVASYCTTFLKPEMLHIYRQVTGLRRYETFIVAKERTSVERFPFPDIEMVPRKPRKNFIRRFWLKHVRHLPALYYRGEMQGMMKIFRRRRADLMHIYFGHTGVHLLPFIKGWGKPCVVSFHGADVMPRERARSRWRSGSRNWGARRRRSGSIGRGFRSVIFHYANGGRRKAGNGISSRRAG